MHACYDRIIGFAHDYEDEPVKLVAVNVSDAYPYRLPGIKEHMKVKNDYTYGYDESQAIGHAYGASATPNFFVLDKERKIRYMGAIDDSTHNESKVTRHYLRDAVDALLAGKTPPVEETRADGCGIRYKQQVTSR